MKVFRILTVVACCAALMALNFGCKKKGSDPEAGKAAVSKVKVPEKPEEVVTATVEALKNKKPVEVYALLPESYRNDIQAVVGTVTSNMDKELFEMGVQILEKLVACIDAQGDKIAETMGKGAPIDLKQAFESVKTFHKLVKDMGLLEFDTFQKFDVAGFLASQGPKLMEEGMGAAKTFQPKELEKFNKMLSEVKTTVKSAEGDNAEIEVTAGEEKETIKLTKVEGRWVPADMAKDWKENVEKAKKEIEKGMKEMVANKEQTKAMMEQILKALTEFEKSGDMSAVQGLMQMAM